MFKLETGSQVNVIPKSKLLKWDKKRAVRNCKTAVLDYSDNIVPILGIKPDPKKIRAIEEFSTPNCKKDLQRFLGMILCESGLNTERDFQLVKQAIMESPWLKYFDGNKAVTISVDASKNGLGTVLFQRSASSL
ncbi:hypothetical protein TNIN_489611 [Trichonephila inaurata madagascariensis]|uniref:Reverse transcriptase/retrotransposon-derived protein RNase H-like domain-containing protein n=1 Tax=Trichonephila inaurata madagascariensis TaxID=2747483 RepID=A0A8X7CRH8_9ARAC|nr:hypothetical protein TNIN_489611 [Trichonephila inaurata madagascariensis]